MIHLLVPGGRVSSTAEIRVRPQSIQRERRLGQGPDGQGHQGQLVVVAGDPVGSQGPAFSAAVDDGPLPVAPHPHGDRFHRSPAPAPPISRAQIHMQAPQTPRTMVAMARAGCAGRCRQCNLVAVLANERGITAGRADVGSCTPCQATLPFLKHAMRSRSIRWAGSDGDLSPLACRRAHTRAQVACQFPGSVAFVSSDASFLSGRTSVRTAAPQSARAPAATMTVLGEHTRTKWPPAPHSRTRRKRQEDMKTAGPHGADRKFTCDYGRALTPGSSGSVTSWRVVRILRS